MNPSKAVLDDLAAILRTNLQDADKRALELGPWHVDAPVGYEQHAAAWILQALYGAIEAFIERCLKVFDGAVPSGKDSHVILLQLASEATVARGIILPFDGTVDELRSFRHRFRKRYDIDLDPIRIHEVVKIVIDDWPKIRRHLEQFLAWVEGLATVALP